MSTGRRGQSDTRRTLQTAQPSSSSLLSPAPTVTLNDQLLPPRPPTHTGESLLCNFPIFFNTPMPVPYYSNAPNMAPTPNQFKYLLFTGFCAVNGILPQNVVSEEIPSVTIEINLLKDNSLPIPDVVTPVQKLATSKRIQNPQVQPKKSPKTGKTTLGELEPAETSSAPSLTDYPPFDPAKMNLAISQNVAPPTTLATSTPTPQYCLHNRDMAEINELLPLVPQLTIMPVDSIPFSPDTSALEEFQDNGCCATISFNITNQERFDQVYMPIMTQAAASPLSNLTYYNQLQARLANSAATPHRGQKRGQIHASAEPHTMNDADSESPFQAPHMAPIQYNHRSTPLTPASHILVGHNIPHTALLVSFCGHSFRLYQATTRPSIYKFYSLSYDLARSYSGEVFQSFFQKGYITPEEAYKSFPNQYHTSAKQPFVNITLYDHTGSHILPRKSGIDHYNYGVTREALINQFLHKAVNFDMNRPLLTQFDNLTQPFLVNSLLSVKGGTPGVLQNVPTYPQLTLPPNQASKVPFSPTFPTVIGTPILSPNLQISQITPSATASDSTNTTNPASQLSTDLSSKLPMSPHTLPSSTSSTSPTLLSLSILAQSTSEQPAASATLTTTTTTTISPPAPTPRVLAPHPFVPRPETTADRVSTSLIASISLPKSNVMPYHDTAHLYPTALLFQHAEPNRNGGPPGATPAVQNANQIDTSSPSTPHHSACNAPGSASPLPSNEPTGLHAHNDQMFQPLDSLHSNQPLLTHTSTPSPSLNSPSSLSLRPSHQTATSATQSQANATPQLTPAQIASNNSQTTAQLILQHQLQQSQLQANQSNINPLNSPSHPLSTPFQRNPNALIPGIPATEHPRGANGVQYVSKHDYLLNKGNLLDPTQTSFYQLDPQLTNTDLDAQYFKLLTNLDSQVGLYKDVIGTIHHQHEQLLTYSSTLINQQAKILQQLQASQATFIQQQQCMNNVLYKLVPKNFFTKAYEDTDFAAVFSQQSTHPTAINIIQPRQVVEFLSQPDQDGDELSGVGGTDSSLVMQNTSMIPTHSMSDDQFDKRCQTQTQMQMRLPSSSSSLSSSSTISPPHLQSTMNSAGVSDKAREIIGEMLKNEYGFVNLQDDRMSNTNTDHFASVCLEHSGNVNDLYDDSVLIDDFAQAQNVHLTHDQMVHLICLRELNKRQGLQLIPQSNLQQSIGKAVQIVQKANDIELRRKELEFELINRNNEFKIDQLDRNRKQLIDTVHQQQETLDGLKTVNPQSSPSLQQQDEVMKCTPPPSDTSVEIDATSPSCSVKIKTDDSALTNHPSATLAPLADLTPTLYTTDAQSGQGGVKLESNTTNIIPDAANHPSSPADSQNNSTLPLEIPHSSTLHHNHDSTSGDNLDNDLAGLRNTKKQKLALTDSILTQTDSNELPPDSLVQLGRRNIDGTAADSK